MASVARRNEKQVVPNFILSHFELDRLFCKYQADARAIFDGLSQPVTVMYLELQVRSCRNPQRIAGRPYFRQMPRQVDRRYMIYASRRLARQSTAIGQ